MKFITLLFLVFCFTKSFAQVSEPDIDRPAFAEGKSDEFYRTLRTCEDSLSLVIYHRGNDHINKDCTNEHLEFVINYREWSIGQDRFTIRGDTAELAKLKSTMPQNKEQIARIESLLSFQQHELENDLKWMNFAKARLQQRKK